MKETVFKEIKERIGTELGLLVREQDDDALRKVITERVSALNLTDEEQYNQLLNSNGDIFRERQELTIPLTAGETYFFRDVGQHALLKERILPELLERHHATHSLRMWSAACSTGEEAYSLAILLDEIMGEPAQWNILILGTDINRHAIEKAQRGIYTEWSFRGMSDERRQRYFRRNKDTWQLDDAIRKRVVFRTGDLVADPFPAISANLYSMDLILCRNTFIYMTPDVVSRIADKFAETLAEGGYLITGHGELHAHHFGKLRARVFPESIVYQKVSAPFSAQRPVPVKPVAGLAAAHKAVAPVSPRQPVPRENREQRITEIQLAWQYANQGQQDRAAKICGGLIAENPLNAEPYYLLALLAQERTDFVEAVNLLKKVIYLDHSFIAAYLDLGDLYTGEGDAPRARKMRSTARDLLREKPAGEPVRFYGASTTGEVLQYLEQLLRMNSR